MVYFLLSRIGIVYYLYPMKNTFVIIISIFIVTSCRYTNKELKEHIINTDSIAINYFPGDGTMDTVVAVKIIREKKNIEQLATFVAARSTAEKYNCGVDGSLHFFKMSKVIQDVDFRMNAGDCMHFSFLQKGELKTSVLTNEAKELLTALKNK